MLLSIVSNTSKLFSTSVSSALFLSPAQPIRGHRLHRVARQITAQPPIEVFVQQDFHLTPGLGVPCETLRGPRALAHAARWETLRESRQSNRPPPNDRTGFA